MRRRAPEPWITTGSAFLVLVLVLVGEAFLIGQAFSLGERLRHAGMESVSPGMALKMMFHKHL